MSILRQGDEDMHYSDNSHRWVAPPDVEQSVWEADLRAHLSQHRTTMGGPEPAVELRECQLARVPAARTPSPRTPGRRVPSQRTASSRGSGTRLSTRRTGAGATPR